MSEADIIQLAGAILGGVIAVVIKVLFIDTQADA